MSWRNVDPYEFSKQIQQTLFQERIPHRKETSGSGIKIQQKSHLRDIDKEVLKQSGKGNKLGKFQKTSSHIFKYYTKQQKRKLW